jgi:hypothetical protein
MNFHVSLDESAAGGLDERGIDRAEGESVALLAPSTVADAASPGVAPAPSAPAVSRDRRPGTIQVRYDRRHGWTVHRVGTKGALSVHRSLLHAERSGRRVAESERCWMFVYDLSGDPIRAETFERRPPS